MPEDKGYEAGPEESQKIEDIIARRGEPEESIEEDVEDYAEDVELAQKVETPRPEKRFKAEEPILLYIRTGIGTYTVVDNQFGSRVEATRFAEENYPGSKYKVMTVSQAVAEGEKQQKRMEKIQQAKEKAREKLAGAKQRITTATKREVQPRVKRYARAGLEASYDVARSHGMTRPQMEPEIRQAWGVEQRAPIREPERAPPQPAYQQRMGFRPPQRPRGGINIPQQPRMRLNIPQGGGVFRSRRLAPDSPESPFAPRPIRTSPAFAKTGIKPVRPYRAPGIRAGGLHKAEMHMITSRGISTGRRPPPQPEQNKKRKKSKRKKRRK